MARTVALPLWQSSPPPAKGGGSAFDRRGGS